MRLKLKNKLPTMTSKKFSKNAISVIYALVKEAGTPKTTGTMFYLEEKSNVSLWVDSFITDQLTLF